MLRPQEGLRLILAVAGLVMLVVAIAYAAPIGALKQFRVPTRNSSPLDITQGSDGNFWFTEGNVLPPQPFGDHNVGRVTPAGDVTEFAVCTFCFPNRIVQGPNGILYFTKSDPGLGRIRTDGTVLADVAPTNTLANGNGVAAYGNYIYYAAFNTHSIWQYDTVLDQFTEFLMPLGANPSDVAVDASGMVWFTDAFTNNIGKLDPGTGTIVLTPIGDGDPNGPRGIAIATDGKIWFTKRFSHVVGFLDPSMNNQVTEFQLATTGPEGIAAGPDGSVWFTQSLAGNVARIDSTGAITEGKGVKGSEPFGITIAPSGDPWYVELSANKIATLQLR